MLQNGRLIQLFALSRTPLHPKYFKTIAILNNCTPLPLTTYHVVGQSSQRERQWLRPWELEGFLKNTPGYTGSIEYCRHASPSKACLTFLQSNYLTVWFLLPLLPPCTCNIPPLDMVLRSVGPGSTPPPASRPLIRESWDILSLGYSTCSALCTGARHPQSSHILTASWPPPGTLKRWHHSLYHCIKFQDTNNTNFPEYLHGSSVSSPPTVPENNGKVEGGGLTILDLPNGPLRLHFITGCSYCGYSKCKNLHLKPSPSFLFLLQRGFQLWGSQN